MSRIYKRTDRIKVRIHDVTVTLAPLSFDQKTEAQDIMLRGSVQKNMQLLSKGIASLVKYSVKNIEGVEDADGNPYKLEFDGDSLSDSCLDDLFNLDIQDKLQAACLSLVKGIPKEIVDDKGQPLEGVVILSDKKGDAANP